MISVPRSARLAHQPLHELVVEPADPLCVVDKHHEQRSVRCRGSKKHARTGDGSAERRDPVQGFGQARQGGGVGEAEPARRVEGRPRRDRDLRFVEPPGRGRDVVAADLDERVERAVGGGAPAAHGAETVEHEPPALVEGLPHGLDARLVTPTNRERVRGYKRAFGEFPGIQVLGSEVGNYQQPDAKRAMEKLLKEHPQIDAVLSANDSMSLGVLEALKEANRTATVISINGILPAVKKVETGEMLATVDFNMFKIGCMATRAAVRQLKNESLPEKVMLPAEIIDKTNYKAWLTPVNQRTCPEWSDLVK